MYKRQVFETRKILGDQSIGVSPTTVRVPVITSHSESVHVLSLIHISEPTRPY